MHRRRAVKGVVYGFLTTYTSRYVSFEGYWLFGFFVINLSSMRIDLLNGERNEASSLPVMMAEEIAVRRFHDQLEKHRFSKAWLSEAVLEITKSETVVPCSVNGYIKGGYNVTFNVLATLDTGKNYSMSSTLLIAPHNARHEFQSRKP